MKIDESRFLSAQIRAEAMGVTPEESEQFMVDLKAETGVKVNIEVARPLLRILEGKQLKGNDEARLLEAIRALHEYGSQTAAQDIGAGYLREWTKDERDLIKLLVATLEGWFYGEHPINIREEHFSLLAFLVNRLAKIAESQTKDKAGNLLVPNYDPEKLKSFIDEVQRFLEANLQPAAIEQNQVEIRQQITGVREKLGTAEAQKNTKIEQAQTANEKNERRVKQKRKVEQAAEDYGYYREHNESAMVAELLAAIEIVVVKLQAYRRSLTKPAFTWQEDLSKDAEVVTDFLVRYKGQLAEELIDNKRSGGYHQDFDICRCLEHVIGEEDGDGDGYQIVSHAFDRIQKDLQGKAKLEPARKSVVSSLVEAPKTVLKAGSFADLAKLKEGLLPPPDPQQKTLRELLFNPLVVSGPVFGELVKKYYELEKEKRALGELTVTPDIRAEEDEIRTLAYEIDRLHGQIRGLDGLKTASPELFNISRDEILRDLQRPAAGLYMLKSIIIALKMAVDRNGVKMTVDASPYTAIASALDKRAVNRGPAKVFALTGSAAAGWGRGHETVHYLPQHMPFSHVAAAKFLKDNRRPREIV